MVKQCLSSWVVIGLALALNVLNIWVTTRKAEALWGDAAKAWLRRPWAKGVAVNALVAGAPVAALLLTTSASLPAAVLFGFSLLLIVAGGHSRVLRFALVFGVGLVMALSLVLPGALSVQLIWLMPLIALVGFLPRLMVLLGRRGRPAYWLMNIWFWAGLLVVSAIIDAVYRLNSAAMFLIGWKLGLLQESTVWMDVSSLGWLDATLYGYQWVSWGMLTPYALFGFLSALALWARRLNQLSLVVTPVLLVVTWVVCTNGLLIGSRSMLLAPVSMSVLVLFIGLAVELPFCANAKDVLLNRHPA